MSKKSSGSKYVSKGERRSIGRWTVNAVRRNRSEADKMMNKFEAWKKGQNPWITVPGTSSKMRFIKVRANDLYGSPKNNDKFMEIKVSND